MKVMHCLLLLLIFISGGMNLSAHAGEVCDSLIRVAIKASIEKNYQYSLELLSQAKQLAIKEKSAEQLFRILTNIGINQAELLNYNDALNNFFDAYKIAVDKLDKRHEMSILNNIAGLYMLDNKYEKATEYYTTVYETVKNSTDSLFIGGSAMNIANAAMNTNNLEQAGRFLQIAEKMLKNYPLDLLKMYSLKVAYLMRKNKNVQAYKLAIDAKRQADKLENSTLQIDIQIALIRVCMALKDYQASIAYALEAFKKDINMEERHVLYDILAEACYKRGEYDKAFAYKDSMIATAYSLWNIQGKKLFENNRIQFELYKREKELEKYRTSHQMGLIVIGLSVLIVIILIWALINQTVKNKQQKKIVELELDTEKKNQQLLQNKLKEQQAQTLLEQKQFQHEIEMKGRELMSHALVMANRNDLIQEVVNTLSESNVIQKSNDPKIKESIRLLRKQLDETEEWKHFTTYFEQVNDAFINSLREKHSELTANEIRFLSLVYINLTNKEISLLLNITLEYCKKKKKQIARKLGLKDTKELYSYLISL